MQVRWKVRLGDVVLNPGVARPEMYHNPALVLVHDLLTGVMICLLSAAAGATAPRATGTAASG